MAVTVARGLERHLQETVLLLIRSDDPPDRVVAGLRAAVPGISATGVIRATGEDVIAGEVIRRDGTRWHPTDQQWQEDDRLAEVERPSYVAEPVTIPGGQLLMIDYASTPARLCRETPAILIRHLQAAGVRNAEIGLAPKLSDRKYGILGSFTPVARAGLLAPVAPYPDDGFLAGVPLAAQLIDISTEWLRRQYQPGMELLDLVISTGVPVTWDSLRPVVENALRTSGYTTLIVSDLATRAAAAVLGAFGYTGISLGAAGAGWAPEQVADQMRDLRDLIGGIAPELGWAGVTSDEASRRARNVYRPGLTTQEAGPMWYQVLSPARIQRLGGPPPGAIELPGGRYELTIGEPEQWVPGHPDNDAILRQARKILPG